MSVLATQQHTVLQKRWFMRRCYGYKIKTGEDFVEFSRKGIVIALKKMYVLLDRCKIDPIFHMKYHRKKALTSQKHCRVVLNKNKSKNKIFPILERSDLNNNSTGVVVQ